MVAAGTRTPETTTNANGTRSVGEAADARPVAWVVDDSPLEAQRVAQLLSADYVTRTFADGDAVLEAFAKTPPPDVIVLDWILPTLSGLEVVRVLREQSDEVSLPVLMLTVRSAKSDFAEALAAGANDYVAKPYDASELLGRVRNLVRVREQSERSRTREAWFSTILRSIHDAVIAADEDGRIEFMNATAERLTGWSEADARGKPCDLVLRFLDRAEPPSRSFANALRDTGEDAPADPAAVLERHIMLRADGSEILVEDTFVPIRVDGYIRGTVAVLRDVTEQQRREDLDKARAEFEQKLAGIVSHDLKNPLQAILLGADTLLRPDGGTSARVLKVAARIRFSASRAARLVRDVLDFTQARLGNGIPVKPVPTDGAQIAAQAIEELLAVYPEREVPCRVSGDVSGEWDPDRLAQVIGNMLLNAVKYGALTTPITVNVRGDHQRDEVEFSVHNEGDPVPPELLPRLFQPMQRGQHQGQGVGLGLYIVKHIVDAHGGTLQVSSDASGTCFTVRLPRRAPTEL
jgi:PAS domain S-box-containing protein